MKQQFNLLIENLFRPGQTETTGQVIFYRLFEFLIVAFVIEHVWAWGFYTSNLGEVILPLGVAIYMDISFMFNAYFSVGNAVLITLCLFLGFSRSSKYAYLIAILLFHIQYAARFSQGEISHGSNMTGTALFCIAIAHITFMNARERRKFSLGLLIFFIGLGYVTAAFSKLIGTGPFWVDGSHLWLWIGERGTDILSQHGGFGLNLLQEYILELHWLATIILIFGLLTELFGFLFWYNRTRPYAAILLVSMHFGVLLTMNINFPKFVYIIFLVGFPWYRLIDYLISKYKHIQLVDFLERKFSPQSP